MKFNNNSNYPLYMQLYQQLVDDIDKNKYIAGDKLPSVRNMASALSVNKATVIRAYQLLEQHGIVIKKRGSGTFVAKLSHQQTLPLGVKTSDAKRQKLLFDFTSTTPLAALFPVNEFKSALNSVMDSERGAAFEIEDSRGHAGLRHAICEHILSPSNINEKAEHIQILTGAQQGVDVIAKALINFGDVVLVESPTYSGALTIFRQRGARIVSVPITSQGPDILALRAAVLQHRPKLIYAMPRLNNPTGAVYSIAVKKELLRLSNTYKIPILEADISSEFALQDDVKPLRAMPQSNNVFYLKSFSKSVMPGLRLGFVTMPTKYQRDIIFAKATTDIATSGLTQKAFELFIICGAYANQVEQMKIEIGKKYRLTIEACHTYLGKYTEIFCQNGGLSLWLKIKRRDLAHHFFAELKLAGIAVVEGLVFDPDRHSIPYFRLSYVALDDCDILLGIKQIASIFKVLDDRW